MTEQNPELVTMPAGRYVLVPVAAALMVEAALAAAVGAVWPGKLVSVGLGAAAALAGIGVGAVAVQPWKARSRSGWATVALGGHGITIAALTAAAVSLYSATRPDAAAFLAAAALPFPVAMIAQARVVLGPALRSEGATGTDRARGPSGRRPGTTDD